MKKLIISASLIFSALFSFGQGSTATLKSNQPFIVSHNRLAEGYSQFHTISFKDTTRNAEFYSNRSRNQKVAGFLFTGIGAIGLVTGLLSFPKYVNFLNSDDVSKADRAAIITGIGAGLMLGSIPFFILSGVNKRKAKLSYTIDKIEQGVPLKAAGSVTGIRFSIALGR